VQALIARTASSRVGKVLGRTFLLISKYYTNSASPKGISRRSGIRMDRLESALIQSQAPPLSHIRELRPPEPKRSLTMRSRST
jgi:hypothetical protein